MIRKVILALALTAAPAAAHIVLSPDRAPSGSYYAGKLRVGHGCDAAATTELQVAIPESIVDAKPQPKPGWTVDITRAARTKPIMFEGREQRQRVAAITWRGRLPVDQFDEFGLMLKLPAQATGPVYFPAVQTCEAGERRWTQVPAAGAAWTSVKAPAPVLNVDAADPHAGHH